MSPLETTVGHLSDLVGFASISSDGNLDLIAYLAGRLEDHGARVHVQRSAGGDKANLWASFGPDTGGGIVLSGHTDVVPVEGQDWSSDPFALRDEGDLLYGRGTCDMKGFIAACLAVAPVYGAGTLRRPLHMCFTYDEEVGCLGAQALVAEMADWVHRPALAIIGEPTSMRIVEGHKGCCEYTTRFEGLAGHGSDPSQGVSATEYAGRFVGRLLELRRELDSRCPADSPFAPPQSTVQVGGLRGGIAHNVIADHAEVDWELRPVNHVDKAFATGTMRDYANDVLLPAMRAVHAGARIETDIVGEVAGLHPVSDNEARRIVAEITGANTAGTVPFGTEAGLFQGLGMQAIVCGPGSIAQAHKADEYVARDQLAACIDMLTGLDRYLR